MSPYPYEQDRRSEPDPFATVLDRALRSIGHIHTERQMARAARGDRHLLSLPFITVSIETEQRTYEGRVFRAYEDSGTIDLHSLDTENPDTEMVNPTHVIRLTSIVSLNIKENPDLLPSEFPVSKEDLDAMLDQFFERADDVFGDGVDRHEITTEQYDALIELAQPLHALIHEDNIERVWDRYTRAVNARNRIEGGALIQPSLDKRLNQQIVLTDTTGRRSGFPIGKIITHGVPLEFLYPETQEQAMKSYASFVEGFTRRRNND